jgi:hypothetical protein
VTFYAIEWSALPTSLAVSAAIAPATNKHLAEANKFRTAKANKGQEKPYRQRHFGRLPELANGHLQLSLGREAQATTAVIYRPRCRQPSAGAGHRPQGAIKRQRSEKIRKRRMTMNTFSKIGAM